MIRTSAAAVLTCVLMCASLRVEAQEAKSWNQGVTEEQRKLAQPFFDAGNDFFERSMYAKALAEYEKAIAHRDHPAIRYNLAVCLINLGRPVQAHENLIAGMKHGAGPLAKGLFKEGNTYLKLLLGQLAEIRITTEEEGAKVSLNGKMLFIGPGEITLMVKPEQHLVTTTKPGMLADNQEIIPRTSESNVVSIKLFPPRAKVRLKPRWAPWKPWAVIGAGVALSAAGVPLYVFARRNMSDYDDEVITRFDAQDDEHRNQPLDLPNSVTDLRSKAKTQNVAAISLFVSGAAVLTTGVVLLVLNRPQREKVPAKRSALDARNLSITPIVDGNGSGLMSRYSFEF